MLRSEKNVEFFLNSRQPSFDGLPSWIKILGNTNQKFDRKNNFCGQIGSRFADFGIAQISNLDFSTENMH